MGIEEYCELMGKEKFKEFSYKVAQEVADQFDPSIYFDCPSKHSWDGLYEDMGILGAEVLRKHLPEEEWVDEEDGTGELHSFFSNEIESLIEVTENSIKGPKYIEPISFTKKEVELLIGQTAGRGIPKALEKKLAVELGRLS